MSRRLAVVLGVAACAGPTAPRNRAGIAAAPGAAGAEYERFLDGDADRGAWSIGATVGVVWRGLDGLLAPRRERGATLVAINPFVRWHAYRPTDWLALGFDTKLSLVWLLPDGAPARFAPALEAHGMATADHRWAYALVGVGVKQFLLRRDVAGSRFPAALTMPASEAAIGVRF